ncbi:uncharacterized protein LOC144653505 [Oculina patagonica]
MSSFLPSIDSVGKSSLVAAKRIYSALDYLEGAANNGCSGKKRPGRKKSRKLNPPTDQSPHQKAERTKEYSQKLKSRRERAKLAREESSAERKNQEELRKKGLSEKRRLNELFSVYAAQQGPSYRDSAKVVKPKFPVLLKTTKSSAISREKIPYTISPLPNLSSFNRLDKESHE